MTRLVNRSTPIGLRRSGQIVHLARRHIVKAKIGIRIGSAAKGFVKFLHRLPKQNPLTRLVRSVRVQLYEEPIRAMSDPNPRIQP